METKEQDLLTASLLRRARDGESAALGSVLDALRGELAALIRQAKIHSNDRQDAVQEAILVVIACLGSYNPQLGTFRAYICGAVRRMLGRFRAQTTLAIERLREPTYWPADELVAGDLLEVSPHAEIVRDYYGIDRAERSVNQIAAARHMAPKTVRNAITEAIQAMREAS